MIALRPQRPLRRTETTILSEIRAALNAIPGVRVWRNNVGMLRDETGRPVRYGLALGSADLIGSAWGRALAVEVKGARGKLRPDQVTWRDVVLELGWIYVLARSAEDAVLAVEAHRGGQT